MVKKIELRKILAYSVIAGAIYGVFFLIAGLLTNFNILLLDGIYTIIGSVTSLISLYVSRYIEVQDFDNFPFGKEALMPLLVFVQYGSTLLISIYGVAESIVSLLHMETSANEPIGLYFSLLGACYCWLFSRFLTRNQQVHPFFQVEVEQWRFGFFFSLGVSVSFLVSTVLEMTDYALYANYIDPVVSIGITLFFIFISIKEIRDAILEISSSTPKPEIRQKLMVEIEDILQEEVIRTYVLRSAKMGEQLVVELDIVIFPSSVLDSILYQDYLREKINQRLLKASAPFSLWLNVNFIGDIKWAGTSSTIK